MKELHQVFDLVRLQNISESWHSSATLVDLMLDLLLFQALSDRAEIRPQFTAAAIHAMAMLAPPFRETAWLQTS